MCMIDGYFPAKPSDYLRTEFEMRKRRNPSYSIRAFARDLDLSPSHLSEFFSGKASLSLKKIGQISTTIHLNEDQKEHWSDLISLNSKASSSRQKAKLRVLKRMKDNKSQVNLETFKVIADWYHFAILAFFGVNERYTSLELSKHLSISEEEAKEGIRRLKTVGLLERTESGHRPTANTNFAGECTPSEAIRESQRQVLGKAVEALERFEMSERVNQSFFFSVPQKNLAPLRDALKKRILETVSEFSDDGEPQPGDAIQALTWHLFPLEDKK